MTFKLGEFGLGFRRSYLDLEKVAVAHVLNRELRLNVGRTL